MYIDPYYNIQPEKISKKDKQAEEKGENAAPPRQKVSPGVKKFAYFGLAVVVLSILLKHGFNAGMIKDKFEDVFFKVQCMLMPGKAAKAKSDKKRAEGINKAQLISVIDFDGSKKPGSAKDLVVEGIFFDPDGVSFVVLNGEVVCEGQSWMGVTVKAVSRESVEIEVNGESRILSME